MLEVAFKADRILGDCGFLSIKNWPSFNFQLHRQVHIGEVVEHLQLHGLFKMVDILSVTVCAIFGVSLLLSLCTVARRMARVANRPVFFETLGWVVLSMFCFLRVIDESLWIASSNRAISTTIFVLALTPLLLATGWILCLT